MSSSSKRHESSSSDSSTNTKSQSNSNSHSKSKVNEEEDAQDSNKSNSNSLSDQLADEGLLQKIESMPSLDSEFLMSPHNKFPSFSKKEASQASNDIQSIDSKNYSESDDLNENDLNHFPSIMPDELPINDPSMNNLNMQNEENNSSSSFEHSNSNSDEIKQDVNINQNLGNGNNNQKLEKVTKRRARATFAQDDKKKRTIQLVKKSSFPFISKDIYTYDFENDDDDGDPSSALPLPMPMSPTSPESHSRRRQTLPLKRSSLTESERETIQKDGATIKPNFLGYEGMDECEPTLLKTCHNCSKQIKEDGTFINGWYYHKKCLVCDKCGKKLDQQKNCYMYHEKLMCDECVHIDLKTIKICRICGQKIFNSNEEVELPNKQIVHASCISCYMCGKNLTLENAIVVDDDNNNSCLNSEKEENETNLDNDDQNTQNSKPSRKKSKSKSLKPKPRKKKPKICNDRRTSNFSCDTLVIDTDGIKMPKYVCKSCHSHLMKEQICCVCKHPVLANIVVKNQRVFHRQCFRCEHKGCDTLLFGNSYVVHHNKFLCWEHGKIFSSSCAYCKQLFKFYETDKIKWNSKLYHKSCFVCRVCGQALDPQMCKSIHGRPHCDQCFQLRVREGDCDEKGRSPYIHYSQIHNHGKNKIHLENDEEEEKNSKNDASFSNSSNTDYAEEEEISIADLDENNKKKHQTHLHFAREATKRKNRFFMKYHVDVNFPEYGERLFEKAQPYKPEEEKNVFKKF